MEQLSLLEQSRVMDPKAGDFDHVRRIARNIAAELDLVAPVDFEVVTSYQGISAVEVAQIPWAGCLLEERGRLVIKLRQTDPDRRRRFTWAHELAHTFFPGFRYQPQFRCNPSTVRQNNVTDIETLCDLAAAELLFPADAFTTDLQHHPLTLTVVEDLADKYLGGLEATAHRAVDLTDQPALMIVLKEMNKPTDRRDPDARPKLRVSYAYGSGSWPFIPRYKSADAEGPLSRALNGEVVNENATLHEFTNQTNQEAHVSAKPYPYRDELGTLQQRVIAIYR